MFAFCLGLWHMHRNEHRQVKELVINFIDLAIVDAKPVSAIFFANHHNRRRIRRPTPFYYPHLEHGSDLVADILTLGIWHGILFGPNGHVSSELDLVLHELRGTWFI